ncbi:MAG: 50S ribosomal protein L1 [Parcubacteria group bacterium GW2011_GWA1_36_12]|nr:MAG: 50S ribosomal protein L1 [Parcubacteria group bacterium GW2011_GWA1_36_12]
MGKIRVKTLGDESQEKQQAVKTKERREQKKMVKEKAHVKGVGLKGGQKVSVVEGEQLKPEIEAMLKGETASQEEKVEKKAKKIKLKVHSKRYLDLSQLVDKTKTYKIKEAIDLLLKTATTKFDASVDAHININAETLPKDKKSLSGTVNLPHGTGKTRKIVIVDETVLKNIENGKIDFDVLITQPQYMSKLAKFAKVLGPKGLMPNPKNGTITPTPEKRAKELAGGELAWKTEPDHPNIHQTIGKISFGDKKLTENLKSFVKAIGAGKIVKFTLASSMGPGIKVDVTLI